DPRKASRQALFADLEAMNYVSFAESKDDKDLLLVTVDMPYPAELGSLKLESVGLGWDKFHRNDLSSDQATKSESPASAKQLPSYGQIRDVVSKHGASLKGIRWSEQHACRPLGCVTAPATRTAQSQAQR
ncbi:MAG TPA: hypothetical protein VFB80_11445, partial [Pirellulaceae bacterium]|nr:hypothetical protein [Pirellulaceae bacterium]